MNRTSLYDMTPARSWLPWTLLAPIVCLAFAFAFAFAFATALPIDAWLAHLGLVDAEGDPIGTFGLMGLLTVSFLVWFALVIAWVVVVERRSLATLGLARPGLRPFLLGLAIGVGSIAGVVAMIALAGGYRAGHAFPAFGIRDRHRPLHAARRSTLPRHAAGRSIACYDCRGLIAGWS